MVKLTHGVNFTSILRAPFSYESFVQSFLCLQWRLSFLFVQEYWCNCANKLLVKLTPEEISKLNIGNKNWMLWVCQLCWLTRCSLLVGIWVYRFLVRKCCRFVFWIAKEIKFSQTLTANILTREKKLCFRNYFLSSLEELYYHFTFNFV